MPFVLWAGRGSRAGLIADLAAEEAATAAALACEEGEDEACQELVAAVLSARPGLDFLCIDGVRPDSGSDGIVQHRSIRFHPADSTEPDAAREFDAGGVALFGVQFVCETDGAVAPLRGLLPTVTFHGQAVEVAILPAPPGAGILDAEDVVEGAPLRFVVSLDSPPFAGVTLGYTIVAADPASAEAGDCEDSPTPDYEEPPSLTVTIAKGNTEAIIEVPTCDDSIDEADETIIVTLGDPSGSDVANLDNMPLINIDDPEASGTISDNDDPP